MLCCTSFGKKEINRKKMHHVQQEWPTAIQKDGVREDISYGDEKHLKTSIKADLNWQNMVIIDMY